MHYHKAKLFEHNDSNSERQSQNHYIQDKTNQEEQLNYYNQYCRLYLANTVLSTQLKQLATEKNQLINKLNKLQKKADQISEGNSANFQEKKKRVRRSASEISRHYECHAEGCRKAYGSQGSLNQHIKIKHPQIYVHHQDDNKNIVKQQSQFDDMQ